MKIKTKCKENLLIFENRNKEITIKQMLRIAENQKATGLKFRF